MNCLDQSPLLRSPCPHYSHQRAPVSTCQSGASSAQSPPQRSTSGRVIAPVHRVLHNLPSPPLLSPSLTLFQTHRPPHCSSDTPGTVLPWAFARTILSTNVYVVCSLLQVHAQILYLGGLRAALIPLKEPITSYVLGLSLPPTYCLMLLFPVSPTRGHAPPSCPFHYW